MWTLFEPLHDVTYFAAEAREHFEQAGLRGFWRGYFAGRAAPLGAVEAAPVIASFFNFAPQMVQRALPAVWSLADPARSLRVREEGAVAALTRLLAGQEEAAIAEAADLLAEAASQVDTGGRVLAAANAALPRPQAPLARLWHATTVLREHRGDGHVAALVAAELDGCSVLVWRSSLDLSRDVLQPGRGWSDAEWEEATQRLRSRGWLNGEGRATGAAAQAHREIEAVTDRVAQRPWDALGPEKTGRLVRLLTPLAMAAYEGIPDWNPIGLPPPVVD
jgi:Helix-turn-helix family